MPREKWELVAGHGEPHLTHCEEAALQELLTQLRL